MGLIGALLGALGGLVFALMLGADTSGTSSRGGADLLAQMRSGGALLLTSVTVFAALAWALADRTFARFEGMYQGMLAGGAEPPAHKPQLRRGERWPAVLVGVTMALLAGTILALIIAFG